MPNEDPERVGVLVISVRVDGAGDRLVAQLTSIDRLDSTQETATVAGDLEEVVERVRAWLATVTER
jgi:hypothetical protein